jgi:hypothetical protein
VFVDARGGSGACLVAFVRVLEVVCDVLSGGEARAQGAVAVKLARGRSPLLSGIHGEDMDAGSKRVSLGNSRSGRHGKTR